VDYPTPSAAENVKAKNDDWMLLFLEFELYRIRVCTKSHEILGLYVSWSWTAQLCAYLLSFLGGLKILQEK
jgi:hypothetical protein